MSYSDDQELAVIEFIDKIAEPNKFLKCDVNIENEEKISSEIEKSNLVILFITKDCKKSKLVEKEVAIAKKFYKLLIPVVLGDNCMDIENLLDYDNNFLVIKIEKPLDSNTEAFKRFQALLFRSLQIVKYNWIDLQLILIKKLKQNFLLDDLKFISDEEVIIRSKSDILKVINIKTGEIVSEIHQNDSCAIYLFVWIAHLSQILVILFDYKTFELDVNFYDKSGENMETINLLEICEISSDILFLNYEPISQNTYLAANQKTDSSNATIFIFDKYFNYVCKKELAYCLFVKAVTRKYIYVSCRDYLESFEQSQIKNEILVYDLYYNYVTTIQASSSIENLICDSKQADFIFIQTKTGVEILNSESLSIVGIIECPFQLKIVLNDKMIFTDLKEHIFVYKIDFLEKKKADSKFICRANPLKSHLYSNPYLLPCNNSACLECIYQIFNIAERKFKCNFELCKNEHTLQQELQKNVELMENIHENIELILKNLLKYGKKVISEGIQLS